MSATESDVIETVTVEATRLPDWAKIALIAALAWGLWTVLEKAES